MAKIENLDYDKLLEKINKGENVTMYGIVTTLDDNYNEMLYNENASIQYSITDYDFFINEDGKIDFSQNKNAIYAIKDYLLKKCGDYQIDLSFVSETKDGPYKNAYLYVIIMNFVFIYIMCKLKSYCN